MATEFEANSGEVRLSGEEAGEGIPVLLLHGLTATRRYVVMGSKVLERLGHRVIQYDARAHGHSSPGPAADAYDYDLLGDDAIAVMDRLGVERGRARRRLNGGTYPAQRDPQTPRARGGNRGDHPGLQR